MVKSGKWTDAGNGRGDQTVAAGAGTADPDPDSVIRQFLKTIASHSPKTRPRRGTKYRSLICCVTRNDRRLKEFLVRSLIVGFSHIAIYDNNQIDSGRDLDVAPLVKPFVDAGVVTHVPWKRGVVDPLKGVTFLSESQR